MISARVEGKRIYVRCPYEMKDSVKSIPGSWWDKKRKMWRFPKSPMAAKQISEIGGVTGDRKFMELVDSAIALDDAQEIKDADEEDLEPLPFDTPLPPWKHQLVAFHFMRRVPSCLLYMGMGTGKTRIVLDYIRAESLKKILVVCPKSVIVSGWGSEIEKHFEPPCEVALLHKRSNKKRLEQAQETLDQARARGIPAFIIINYESVWRDPFGKWAKDGTSWDIGVADEVHRIKAPGSKVSLYFRTLGRRIDRRVGLSGTPLAHSPLDAYGIFRYIDPGVFGTSYTRFKARYAVMGGWKGKQVIDYQREGEYRERFYSRTYEVSRDVLDLPEVQHIDRTFELDAKSLRIYRELKDEFVTAVEDGFVTAANALTRLLRLQQVTSGFLKDDDGNIRNLHNDKSAVLQDVLDAAGDEPIVVYCRFRHDIDMAKRACDQVGLEYKELSGSADELVEWQSGSGQVLISQIQSGSEGVDFTRARLCVYYSLGFSLSRYEQSLARTHRPGQTRNVTYYHLIAEGTVDRKVYSTLQRRQNAIEAILSDPEEEL